MDEREERVTEPLCSGGGAPLTIAKDTRTAVRWALGFLGFMRVLCQMPAVCFDIDGTVLMNMKDGRTRSDNYMRRLLQACQQAGIAIFYVTARPDEPDNREYTERQLVSAGLDLHTELYMMPEQAEYGHYKWSSRRDIEKRGYTILLSVGDQSADIHRDARFEDDKIFIGRIGDNHSFGIKLPSEFL